MSTQPSLDASSKVSPFWLQWLIATGLGWSISNWVPSLILFNLINFFHLDTFNGPSVNTMTLAFLRGLFVGTIIGGFQYLVVRKMIDRGKSWILSNSISWAFAYMAGSWANWTVFQSSPTSRDIEIFAYGTELTVIGICVSISLAFLQWSLVKRNVTNSVKWFSISIAAWSAPLIAYAVLQLALGISINNGFRGITVTKLNLIVNLFNCLSIITHQSIGITAGAIISRAFDSKLKNM